MRDIFKAPAAREAKPAFEAIPAQFQAKITDFLNSKVVEAQMAYGGFSPSAGFILTLADGRRIFCKGSHPEDTSHATMNLRQEIHAYEISALIKDISPAYLGMLTDGDEDGWALGFWQYIDATSTAPSLQDMMSLLIKWEKSTAPLSLPLAREHNYLRHFICDEKKWRHVAGDKKIRHGFLSLIENKTWLEDHLDLLIRLQQRLPDLPVQNFLVHGDMRQDNFIAGQSLHVIDWANACQGPAGLDMVFLAAHLISGQVSTPQDILQSYRDAGGRADPETLGLFANALAGYFATQAFRPVPKAMPRLRWMQKSMLYGGLRLLESLGEIDSHPIMLDSIG